MSHHKTAGTIGATSGCMATVKHALSSWGEGDTDKTCPLGEREMQTKPCLSPWGTETRQRHSGHWVLSIHEMKLNTLKVCRPRGLRRTIGTVTVICGNNLKGFTCRAPRGKAEISSSTKQRTSVQSSFFPSSTRIQAQYAN
jgi:hypothetical protein